MKKLYRVVLVMGLMMMTAVSVEASEVSAPDDEITTQVFVMNNYLTDVRVYLEDAEGKLHHMTRLTRGSVASFDVPAEISTGEFRVKVYPAAPAGSPIGNDHGIKTNLLDSQRDQQVRVWVEADLPSSIVEIARD